MQVKFVDLQRQYQSPSNLKLTRRSHRPWRVPIFIFGEDVARFEEEFADFCEAEVCCGPLTAGRPPWAWATRRCHRGGRRGDRACKQLYRQRGNLVSGRQTSIRGRRPGHSDP